MAGIDLFYLHQVKDLFLGMLCSKEGVYVVFCFIQDFADYLKIDHCYVTSNWAKYANVYADKLGLYRI